MSENIEFYRIDKKLKGMRWSERFMYGLNAIHVLYFIIGVWANLVGFYLLVNYPSLTFMFFEGAEEGLPYGVIFLCFAAGMLASSTKFHNDFHIIGVLSGVTTRIVFWSIAWLFMIAMFNNLEELHPIVDIWQFHPVFLIKFGGWVMYPYTILMAGWAIATIFKRYGDKTEQREPSPS